MLTTTKMALACAAMLVATAGQAHAGIIVDFEGTGLTTGTVITNQIPGLTITGAKLWTEGVSSPPGDEGGFDSIYGPSTASSGAPFDNNFLTYEGLGFLSGSVMRIEFSPATGPIAFTLADIDPSSPTISESVTITARDASNSILQSLTVKSDDFDTGDGHGTLVGFSAQGIEAIEILNNENTVYGVDNIHITSVATVPEPTSLAIFGIGAIGMFVRRRRKQGQTA